MLNIDVRGLVFSPVYMSKKPRATKAAKKAAAPAHASADALPVNPVEETLTPETESTSTADDAQQQAGEQAEPQSGPIDFLRAVKLREIQKILAIKQILTEMQLNLHNASVDIKKARERDEVYAASTNVTATLVEGLPMMLQIQLGLAKLRPADEDQMNQVPDDREGDDDAGGYDEEEEPSRIITMPQIVIAKR